MEIDYKKYNTQPQTCLTIQLELGWRHTDGHQVPRGQVTPGPWPRSVRRPDGSMTLGEECVGIQSSCGTAWLDLTKGKHGFGERMLSTRPAEGNHSRSSCGMAGTRHGRASGAARERWQGQGTSRDCAAVMLRGRRRPARSRCAAAGAQLCVDVTHARQ